MEKLSGPPGYHLAFIKKGVFGERSKIREELEEFIDAVRQGVRIMALVELSDLMGAIGAYISGGEWKAIPAQSEDTIHTLIHESAALPVPTGSRGLSALTEIASQIEAADNQAIRQQLVLLICHVSDFLAVDMGGKMTIRDLIDMSDVTQRAFINGHRS